MKPLVVTMGDPAGIGPEVILKALPLPPGDRTVFVFGDAATFRRTASGREADLAWPVISLAEFLARRETGSALIDFANVPAGLTPGRDSAAGGQASVEYIRQAVSCCLAGQAGAIATAPISKMAIAMAGSPYPGHTEMLADWAGGCDVRMSFALPEFWTILATTHVPLRAVADMLTVSGTLSTLRLAAREIGRYRPRVRIVVAGLNPHASEGGLMGQEEETVLSPAVQAARAEGFDVSGPLPADTVFLKASRGQYDVVLAHYHDQGLIPVKLLGFDRAVNVSLGLPFLRTSPCHGTAYDIAGRGVAAGDSMRRAVELAWAGLDLEDSR